MASAWPAGDVRTGDEHLIRTILLWCFERLYHELAWSYDAVSWLVSGGRWREWQRVAASYVFGRDILDVGCGSGRFLGDLLDRDYQAYGLDRSPQMWRRAERWLRSRGHPGRIVGGDALELPFGPATFDCLVLTFPAPFERDPRFWSEAARVVRPGGRVVVVEGAASNSRLWPGLLERLWESRPRQSPFTFPRHLTETPPGQPSRWSKLSRAEVSGPAGTVWLVVASRNGQENSALTDSLE